MKINTPVCVPHDTPIKLRVRSPDVLSNPGDYTTAADVVALVNRNRDVAGLYVIHKVIDDGAVYAALSPLFDSEGKCIGLAYTRDVIASYIAGGDE